MRTRSAAGRLGRAGGAAGGGVGGVGGVGGGLGGVGGVGGGVGGSGGGSLTGRAYAGSRDGRRRAGPGRPPAAAGDHPGGADEGDTLPAELDVSSYVGQYTFPDIRRRRWPAFVYLLVATACFVAWAANRGGDAVLVNGGTLGAALALLAIGTYHLAAAWPLSVRDSDALVAAARQVGFPVGHASAQLGWRGLRSRPTWRILLYSNEEPPKQRGLVLVDGVDGEVLDHFVEDNPEDWS